MTTLTLEDISKGVCEYYQISEENFFGRSRNAPLPLARGMYTRIAFDNTKYITRDISIGMERDHATTIHYKNKMQTLTTTEKQQMTEILVMLDARSIDLDSNLRMYSNMGRAYELFRLYRISV